MGEAIALAMAKEGVDLVLAARSADKLANVRREVEALGRKALAVPCDVTGDEDVGNLQDAALAAYGAVDILVNNAGIGIRGNLEDTAMADWEHLVEVNLLGYVRVIQAFLPHFLERGGGYIVNVSSIQALGYTGETMNIPYITTKAGINGLTESLYGYLGPKGIKVSGLIPGGVRTDIHASAVFVGSEEEKARMLAEGTEAMKLPFFLSAEELATGLIEGMKREDYLILVPDSRERLLPQGRDIDALNAFMKKSIEPGAPPPFRSRED